MNRVSKIKKAIMNESNRIQHLRNEKLLKEAFIYCFSSIESLSDLSILEVKLSRGKSDAVVIIDKSYLDNQRQKVLLAKIKEFNAYITNELLRICNWYRLPKFSFKFTKGVAFDNKIEALFNQINNKSQV